MSDMVIIGNRFLRVHEACECEGDVCCIHNPSDHHMTAWHQYWRDDRGIMERLCPHGVGHPDPDDRAVRTIDGAGIHGCDGCCRKPISVVTHLPELD